jgi:hypothetical protein
MTPKSPDDRAQELPPAEAARTRRRDHDAAAIDRKGMRTGLAKQFKQVLDAQVKRARDAAEAAGPDKERAPASRPSPSQRRKRGKPVAPTEDASRGA